MSEFSINNKGIKIMQSDEKCVYKHSGFIDIHEKREGISRCRRKLDEKITYKSQQTPKRLIKKK